MSLAQLITCKWILTIVSFCSWIIQAKMNTRYLFLLWWLPSDSWRLCHCVLLIVLWKYSSDVWFSYLSVLGTPFNWSERCDSFCFHWYEWRCIHDIVRNKWKAKSWIVCVSYIFQMRLKFEFVFEVCICVLLKFVFVLVWW